MINWNILKTVDFRGDKITIIRKVPPGVCLKTTNDDLQELVNITVRGKNLINYSWSWFLPDFWCTIWPSCPCATAYRWRRLRRSTPASRCGRLAPQSIRTFPEIAAIIRIKFCPQKYKGTDDISVKAIAWWLSADPLNNNKPLVCQI